MIPIQQLALHWIVCVLDSKKSGVPCQNPNFLHVICIVYIYIRIAYCIDFFNCLPATAKINISFSMAPHSQPSHCQHLAFTSMRSDSRAARKTPTSSNMQHAKRSIWCSKCIIYMYLDVFSFMHCSVVSRRALNFESARASTVKAVGLQSKTIRYNDLNRNCNQLWQCLYTTLLDTFTWRDGPHRLLKLLTGHLRHRSSRTGTQTSSNICSVTRIPRGSSGSLSLSNFKTLSVNVCSTSHL